ncbi:MAG: anthranilate/aminodeoxychorismate synthase component II [Lentisphaerae bacterium GWF2_45_14]|nr:MAG: anthranilate/aminodeoxychorismate synthase component II [Lentisphaerae bacterium GWF2_45_14]
MILMIDNYDSFTYNIVQYLGELGCFPRVVRNDEISAGKIEKSDIRKLIVSPGPCTPEKAGISCEAIRICAGKKIPVLGICLGHQSIGQVFGGKIIHAPYLMHGKVSAIRHNSKGVFKEIPSPFSATRYHSLVIERESCPDILEITAETDHGVIMGVKHRELEIHGVQFHPESILTEHGHKLLKNFLDL